jgi:hypothetical protein
MFSRNPQNTNQPLLFFAVKYFSKFFNFESFSIIFPHLTKPSGEWISSYETIAIPLAQQLVVRSVFLKNLRRFMSREKMLGDLFCQLGKQILQKINYPKVKMAH